ncbi:MAG: 30S ribosomal protein S4 [Thermoplasmata archaeon]|nr:MAG: 30S ribosomal protein S4 [Thermoplasmata archaeon]
MGDPKFSRRKYDTPSHPWQGTRIKEENELLKKYGLKNKRELWKAQSELRNYRRQARTLLARLRLGDMQAQKERKGLLKKLANLGVLPEDATLDDVLALDVERMLERRLQTLVYIKGLAYTPKQARQLIVHGHATVNERMVTVPGYLVKKNEEPSIAYNPYSPLASELHPARPTAEHIERVSREFTMQKETEKVDEIEPTQKKGAIGEKDQKKKTEEVKGKEKESEGKDKKGEEPKKKGGKGKEPKDKPDSEKSKAGGEA